MKKVFTILLLICFFSSATSYTNLYAQSTMKPANAGKELKEGLAKLTADKNLKSGLHTIFKSPNGTMYCVKLKNGEVDKLIVTSGEGDQVKPKIIKSPVNKDECIVQVVLSKKPLIEEYWQWFCAKKK